MKRKKLLPLVSLPEGKKFFEKVRLVLFLELKLLHRF